MRHKQTKAITCPFYSCEEDVKLHCEGVVPRTSIHLTFRSPAELLEYRKKYCEEAFVGCRLAKMLYEKYGEKPPNIKTGEVQYDKKRNT